MAADTAEHVQPETILKQLANLWVDLAKTEQKSGVLRACAMTLLVATEPEQDLQDIGATLAELMHEHPSRAIVLRIGAPDIAHLHARVFAQCWMPFGRRQQICCEQIEISAPLGPLDDLRRLVLGLTVPDLPVVLWIHTAHLAADPNFCSLSTIADKVILDSAMFDTADAGLAVVRDLRLRCGNVADLVWTRLTRWREVVAMIFQNEELHRFAHDLRRVSIRHGGPEPPVAARYLQGWFQQILPSAVVAVEAAPGRNERLVSIELAAPDFSASIVCEPESAFGVLTVNGRENRIPFPPTTDYSLLREELSILGPDAIFARSFR